MVVVLSRFRVANGMEGDVARAFRERPRAVEQVPGFLWLEVFTDQGDPALFYLLTRWTDINSFERWHDGPAHRESHALIPKGLKLDPSWTKVYRLPRLDRVTGSAITEAMADGALLAGAYAASSAVMALLVLAPDASIRVCNRAVSEPLEPGGTLDGKTLTDYMPAADGERLLALLAQPRRHEAPVLLNFAAPDRVPFTLACWLDVTPDGATIIGEPPQQRDRHGQDELMAVNQELAVQSRERERLVRAERTAREAAERLNRDRNAFLSVLAHELRQPLGSALAAMGVLRKMNPDPALDRPRSVVERQLTQLKRLVEDLADTARLATGEIVLRQTDIDLVTQLRELATVWEAMALGQGKSFEWHALEAPLAVRGDTDRLQQVFSNLVGNAFKYTPEGGGVKVAVTSAGGFAEISVQDEGEGIAPDRLPHIFELFRRATTTGTGLGVGLAVVRSIVEAHGGTVVAASPGIGRGSTFLVRLPLARL